MREIKFRAWIKDYEVMVTVDFIDFIEGEITIIDHEGIQRIFTLSEVELMQYTGLKDVKGTEIYEGYIVQTGWQGDKKGVVVFENSTYCVDCGDGYMYFNHPESYEIIGNIHENLELMEDN